MSISHLLTRSRTAHLHDTQVTPDAAESWFNELAASQPDAVDPETRLGSRLIWVYAAVAGTAGLVLALVAPAVAGLAALAAATVGIGLSQLRTCHDLAVRVMVVSLALMVPTLIDLGSRLLTSA